MKVQRIFALVAAVSLAAGSAVAQSAAQANEISADLGSCSAQLTVTGTDTKPIRGAKVSTRVQYGLMGMKKLDLEAYTDALGKLKITGLPETLKNPLYIHVEKDGKEQIVLFKPAVHCEAQYDVLLY